MTGKAPDTKLLLKMMKDMLLIRAFEEKVNEMFMMGKIHGTTHLAIGQEAVAAGICAALTDEDWIMPTHRGHGHDIAKSGNVKQIMAELFGKKTGHCQGLGGSMHIADVSVKNFGTSGVVGGTLPIATGIGLALKMQKSPGISVCMFGDGANNQGTFHESLNLASVWKLPVLYVCENNLYGMSKPIWEAMAIEHVADRGQAYNIPSKIVDGNNVLEVYQATLEAAEYIRGGNGPYLMECKTYRWLGHSKSDQRKYRTREEEKQWKEKCPILHFKNFLLAEGLLSEEEFEAMTKEVAEEIAEAEKYAESSPDPEFEIMSRLLYA